MRKLLFFAIIVLSAYTMNAQTNTYDWETNGYFTSFTQSNFGLVFTDNYASRIYLLQNGQIRTLVETPGCGRYFSISPDKNKIGFKLIDVKTGLQTPAVIDLSTKKITPLNAPASLCGQVSFDTNNQIAFSNDNSILVQTQSGTNSYTIGNYSNLCPVSPLADKAIYNDELDQLHILDFSTNENFMLTDGTQGYVYPQWSPDGQKIAYSSTKGYLFVYDLNNNETYSIGKGGKCHWTTNSQYLLYQLNTDSNLTFYNADIYLARFDNSKKYNLTNTNDNFEMSPAFIDNQTIVFSDYKDRKIFTATINWQNHRLSNKHMLFDYSNKQKFYKTYQFSQKNKAITLIPDVPYVHQVYDTPSWHYGYGSCAPTTSIMAIAFYNRLPKWPVEVDHGQTWDPHTNDYGSYVADKYHFNEIYYDYYEAAYGSDAWGGYGYMWDGSYSPSSRMKNYIENHKLVSNQLWTSSCTFDYTKTEIDNGYVHPICNYLTSSGHLILARGYVQGQHTLIFNDPYGNKNTPGYPSYDGVNAYYDWPGYNNGYENLDADGSHGGVAWTVKAEGSQPTYNDTIIDNNYYGHGFYMSNVANGSHMRYFRDYNGGYNNHCWYTLTMAAQSDICWVSWTPTLAQDGDYEVFTYIPDNYATTNNARYHVHYDGGEAIVPVNQLNYSNQWVSLGIYHFTQGQSGYVYLGDSTGTDGDAIAFDAVKWEKMPADIQFTTTDVSCYGLNDGEATASTTEGTPPYDYVWNTVPPQTTQTATNLAAGNYEVTISDTNSTVLTGTVTISQPNEIINNITATNPTQAGLSNGSIILNTTGGLPSYIYVWTPNVSTTNSTTGLAAGTYIIETIDNNSCSIVDTIELIEPFCDAPSGLTINTVSPSTGNISWTGSGNLGYIVSISENGTGTWTYYFTNNLDYTFTGLASNTDYYVSVATICTTDTSVAITDSFTTQALANQTITECYGTFTDAGGLNNDYDNNEDYTVTIEPNGATQISISFYNFSVEANYDTLFVYDGNSTTAPLLGAYSGTFTPFTIVSSGGSLTFRFYSDYATVDSGWNAAWTSYGGDCDMQPTTNADPGCVWKTTDFVQNFTDVENTGLGFNDRFYDVLYSENQIWKTNRTLGFFNDNFADSVIDTAWHSFDGTWSLDNGHLYQNDETSTNTNLSIAVKQDSTHTWLYHWSMEMDGSGANRRAGIYFFCDDDTLDRGNSYMAWFRLDDNLIQLYKVHSNGTYDLVTDDAFTFQVATWYDFKIYFNPRTGYFTAYVNDVKASSYIDSSPYQHGDYFSLRTGNALAHYDDIKVYHSRNSSETVTVGSDTTNAIRAQNEDPTRPAARVKSIVMDGFEHFSTLEGNELNVDWTPPQPVSYVYDGTGSDIDTTNNPYELSANWDTTFDINSGLSGYYYTIGTTPGGSELLAWTGNNLDTAINASGFVGLNNNTTYYFTVKALNAASLYSDSTVSDGQYTLLAPIMAVDADTTLICGNDSIHFQNNTMYADSYYWQFDGGSPNVSTLSSPNVYYSSPGTYDVVFIATGTGGTDTLYFPNYITVGSTPVAGFSATEQEILQPTAIATFINNSTGADSYLWDFGDGSTSTDATPYHIYQDTGYYTVTLIAYNATCGNDTLTQTDYIHVVNNNSVNNFEQEHLLSISPNPFTKDFTITMSFAQTTNLSIILKDITGKQIQELYSGKVVQLFTFTANDLKIASGIYLLEIQTNKEIFNKKIIKQSR